MSDLISRQAAIDALKGLPTWWADEGGYYGKAQPPMVALLDPEDAVNAIDNLPSAQPERKKGRWKLLKNGDAICQKCGFVQVSAWDMDGWDNFCHHCGSYNGGEQDE